MCLRPSFLPLVRDKKLNKQRISFDFPFNFSISNYLDFKDLNKELLNLKIDLLLGKRILSKDEEFVKLVCVPCGQCPECFNNKAKSTTLRILKEAEEHEHSWFVTLTYNDETLPSNYSLVKDEISKFNKKLKVYLSRKGLKSDFRFYGVGEYGGQSARPHYHVIYFGLELDDLKFYKTNEYGQALYTSDFFEHVWSKGFCVIGELDSASAAYVARYTEKKQLQTKSEKEKMIELGFIPEFSVQSMNPGIGSNYLQKVVVSIVNGCYNTSVKGFNYNFPKYYTDKVKRLLEYTPELLAYQNYCDLGLNSSLSGKLLYYGDDLRTINANKIKSLLRNKNKRNDI